MLFVAFASMLEKAMNELEEVWAQKLAEARIRANAAGNQAVADYLNLKASNDAVRQASVEWLFESLTEIAAFQNRNGANVRIETENLHQFAFRNANLVGSLYRFRQGIRCLSVEAGWTRAPKDGFMRGGALAIARIIHFGISKHNAELLLIAEKNAPSWFSVDKNGTREVFDSRHLNAHFQIFLGN